MPYRLLISMLFIIAALLRLAGAMVSSRPSHQATATAASRQLDPTAAMADAQRQFRQMPDNIRASRGGELGMSDGSTRDLGDNPTDQAIRDNIANRTQAAIDEAWGPASVPRHTPGPGEPMMDPTPSR